MGGCRIPVPPPHNVILKNLDPPTFVFCIQLWIRSVLYSPEAKRSVMVDVWTAKLTETQILRELSIEIEVKKNRPIHILPVSKLYQFINYFSNFTHPYTFCVKKIPHWYTFDVKMIPIYILGGLKSIPLMPHVCIYLYNWSYPPPPTPVTANTTTGSRGG